MAYCTNCGAELIENARFCSKCGVELIEMEEELQVDLNDVVVEENSQKEAEIALDYIYDKDGEIEKEAKENINKSTMSLKDIIIINIVFWTLLILFASGLKGHYRTTNSLASAFHDVIWDVKGIFESRPSSLSMRLSKRLGDPTRNGWEDVKKIILDNAYDPKSIKLPPFKDVELGSVTMNDEKIKIATYGFWVRGYNVFGTKVRNWYKIGCYNVDGEYVYIEIYEDGSWEPF